MIFDAVRRWFSRLFDRAYNEIANLVIGRIDWAKNDAFYADDELARRRSA